MKSMLGSLHDYVWCALICAFNILPKFNDLNPISAPRRMLIMKVSAHIGEFTPRLRAHIAARYPYLAIPAVCYPQLAHELFCNMFYLRHLCDTQRFPDWPIPDPVSSLYCSSSGTLTLYLLSLIFEMSFYNLFEFCSSNSG